MNKTELLKWVKEDLIFKRLCLEDMGISLDEIEDTTVLFNDSGLALDSVVGLELAVGIEQKFGIKVGSLNEDIAKRKFATPESIRDYICELLEAKELAKNT